MDRPEELSKRADEYAQRLLVRKREPLNQSFESLSKSLRRRRKIMDAIGKDKPAPRHDETPRAQPSPPSPARRRAAAEQCAKRLFPRRGPVHESTRRAHAFSTSQLGTTISTLTLPNTPSGPADVPPEVRDFLRLALGDEDYDCTDSGASEALSRGADTWGRSLCRSLTRSIRRRFAKRNAAAAEPPTPPRPLVARPELDDWRRVKGLLDLMELYQTQTYQASKALDLCHSMHEFRTSCERVELERLLRLADLGRIAARDEIRRQLCAGPRAAEQCCERAELSLADLSLLLPPAARPGEPDDEPDDERDDGAVEWLVLVASEGLSVWASQAVERPADGGRLALPGRLQLDRLGPDFRLRLGLYSMRLRPLPYNHEDKYHIRPPEKAPRCPSPRRLLGRRSGPARSPPQLQVRFTGLRQSGFGLRASIELGARDLAARGAAPDGGPSIWPLLPVDDGGLSCAGLMADLRCRLRLSVRHSGFLTLALGDGPGGLLAWSRRWCVLEAASLRFWNYPREAEDGRAPQSRVDLARCVSPSVQLAERALCPRARTLLLETATSRGPHGECSRVRHLLSCDTQQDLQEWQCNLNHVVSALRQWNLLLKPDYGWPPQTSDL